MAGIEHKLQGPEGGHWVTTAAAAAHVGVSRQVFRQLVGLDRTELTLPGVPDWMKPRNVAKAKAKKANYRWLSKDVVVLLHLWERLQQSGAAPALPEEDAEDDEDEGEDP